MEMDKALRQSRFNAKDPERPLENAPKQTRLSVKMTTRLPVPTKCIGLHTNYYVEQISIDERKPVARDAGNLHDAHLN